MTWVLLALAGGIGAVVRDRVATGLRDRPHGAHVATALVNLAGALALGLAVGAWGAGDRLAIVGTGFLGGLTTFSTWMVQATVEADRGVRVAVLAVPLALGIAFAVLGVALGEALTG